MSTDPFRRLRRADPAAAMPRDDEHDRERLRRAIVATPLDPGAADRRRRRLRRPAVLVFVGAAVLLLGGGAVYAKTVLLQPIHKQPEPSLSAAQSQAEYLRWTREIALPPGAHWRAYRPAVYAGGTVDSIHFSVVMEAIGHWTLEWLTSTADGHATRATAARDWVGRLRATIPLITTEDTAKAFHSTYGTESMSGFDPDAARYFDHAIADAKEGRFSRLVSLTVFQTFWPGQVTPRDPGQAHEVDWRLTVDGKVPVNNSELSPVVSTAEARAEGLAALRAVGAPPGSDLAHRLFDGVPPGIDPRLFPPGALAENDAQHRLGDEFQEVFDKLWVGWWDQWVAAAEAGDEQRVAAAEAATGRLAHLLPATLSWNGHVVRLSLEPEPAQRDLSGLAAQARAGHLDGMRTWLDFQRRYWTVRLDWAGDFVWDVCGDALYPVSWAVADDASNLPPGGLAFEKAAERDWLSCWRAWYAAISAGDAQKAAAEAQASKALRARLVRGWPTSRSAGTAAHVALSPATLRQFDRLDAQARRGDALGLQHWLIYQVLYETAIGRMARVGTTG